MEVGVVSRDALREYVRGSRGRFVFLAASEMFGGAFIGNKIRNPKHALLGRTRTIRNKFE